MPAQTEKPWPRVIALVDMDAFFASIEQLDRPELRGRAIGITNGQQGTCLITCSYEARTYGIKTGMRIKEAKGLCKHFVQVPARPGRYVEVSKKIMAALATITPDVEVFSVDEAFLDLTTCQLLYGHPMEMGKMIKAIIYEASGLSCSVGISGDKTTAKFAAKLGKPNGLSTIPPWDAKARLGPVNVTELSGIKAGTGKFLAMHGAVTCKDVEKIPISILAGRSGNIGRRTWYMCQGRDPEAVHLSVPLPKSMGHGKVMPPNTADEHTIKVFIMHMCEKLGERLRAHHFKAQSFFAGLLNYDHGWAGGTGKLSAPTHDTREIYQLALSIIHAHWRGLPICQVQVTALSLSNTNTQLDFFIRPNEKREKLYKALDLINKTFGGHTIAPALLLFRSPMPNVIAPAWKPYGHRQHI